MVSPKKQESVIQVETEKNIKMIKRNPNAKHPVEIEYWYILPSIRREISSYLKFQKSFKQKEIANILGITEAGVSQYLKGTRGVLRNNNNTIIELPDWIKKEVSISCEAILKDLNDQNNFLKEVNRLLLTIRERAPEFLCKLHFELGYAEEDCDICLDTSS